MLWKVRDWDYKEFPVIKKLNNLDPPNFPTTDRELVYSVALWGLRKSSCGMVFIAGQEESESLEGPLLRAKECG